MVAYRDELIGRTLGGRFRLIEALGVGASATVYLADDRQLSRHVAVKVLHRSLADDPSFLRRFRAEAQAAAALNHQNILSVFDWGEDGVAGAGGLPYLVTEYLAGGSLRSMLDRGRLLSPSQALLVGLEVARGLEYAHRRGVVHRDIKPANLLFGEDGRLRIADFGLARAIAEATWTEPVGVVLGTARYASPEQAKGQPVDGTTDVYSLALTLVEAVTGTVPFAGETTVATLMNRVDKLLPVSAELSHLAPILERAGRPNPAERFDAGELARTLVRAAERLPRPAPLPIVRAAVSELERANAVNAANATAAAAARSLDAVDAGDAGNATGSRSANALDATNLADVTAVAAGDGPPPIGGAAKDIRATDTSDAIASAAATAIANMRATASAATTAKATATSAGNGLRVSDGALITAKGPGPSTVAPTTSSSAAEPDDGDDSPIDDDAGAPSNRGRRLVLFLSLALLAGLGAVAIAVVSARSQKSFAVGNYVARPFAEVRNEVEGQYGWIVTQKTEKSDQYERGVVISQAPAAGELRRGGELILTVSDGAPTRPLPDVTGKPKDQAAKLVTDAGLIVADAAEEAFDETVIAGSVISWTVAGDQLKPGAEVPKGTEVKLVVSKGPKPRPRPSLKDMNWEQAKATIEGLQLIAAQLPDEYSETVAAGLVTRADPPIGTEVAKGGTVQIAISKGPELFVVPDLIGKNATEAPAAIAAANLKPGTVDGDLGGKVTAQTPAAGEKVRRDTKVNVTLG